jgi:cell wall-associated NlpC family hydrolase
MKKSTGLFYLLLILLPASLLLDSCHSSKKAAKAKAANASESSYSPSPNYGSQKRKKPKPSYTPPAETVSRESALATKYAAALGVSKSDITNYTLYKFIDSWYGVPYKFAGRTKSGVDCSDLASLLCQNVYNITVGGTVTDIYKRCTPIKASELQEGDLIFFKINSKSLSHMGIYLQNHKFVHASVHSGVVIDDLGEDYYKRYYWGAGRLVR